jgi:hypothetical protein
VSGAGGVRIVGPDNCPWHYRDPGDHVDVPLLPGGSVPVAVEELCDAWHLNACLDRELRVVRGWAFWWAQGDAVAARDSNPAASQPESHRSADLAQRRRHPGFEATAAPRQDRSPAPRMMLQSVNRARVRGPRRRVRAGLEPAPADGADAVE